LRLFCVYGFRFRLKAVSFTLTQNYFFIK